MSDQIFIIVAVFIIVEILSQMMKLETLGKIFVQFYVTVAHLLIALTLLTYESKELVFYFVSLIAIVNTLRYIIYKIPSVNESKGLRFFIDIIIVGALVFLLLQLESYLPFAVNINVSEVIKMRYLYALGAVLLYEMIQRALDTGLNIRDFLPTTFISFIFVLLSIGSGLFIIYSLFLGQNLEYIQFIYRNLFVFTLIHVGVTLIVEIGRREPAKDYSLLYVIPTFLTLVSFISLFI